MAVKESMLTTKQVSTIDAASGKQREASNGRSSPSASGKPVVNVSPAEDEEQATVESRKANGPSADIRTSASPLQAGDNAVTPAQERLKAGAAAPTSPATLNNLLEPFTNKTEVPEGSRVLKDVPQQPEKPLGILESWKYLPFLAHQASSIATAFASHHIFGPPKKSWGIEMTIFTTILREAADYSHLSNIRLLRQMLDLGQILPTPKDGIVTPVSFKVKRRGLKGFLAESDAAETGTRELNGEWVINKRLWMRMQAEYHGDPPKRGGRSASKSSAPMNNGRSASFSSTATNASRTQTNGSPSRSPTANAEKNSHIGKDKVIFYLHGGAYFVMSPATHRFLTIALSKYTESRIFALDYRLAPECKFPGQLHDAVAGYFRLIYDLKIPPENIVLAGDSAGGGLTAALLLYLRDEGYPLPSGAILMSPWVDLTLSCASWDTNAPFDYLPRFKPDGHLNPVKCLLGDPDRMNKYVTHPYVSPLFGDFTGLPPLLIQGGDAEVLRDEGTLLAHKASMAGVQVQHELYEDCPHVHQAFLFLEASRAALQSCRRFIRHTLSARRPPSNVDRSTMDAELMSDARNVTHNARLAARSLPTSPANNTIKLPAGERTSDSESSGDDKLELSYPTPREGQSSNQSSSVSEGYDDSRGSTGLQGAVASLTAQQDLSRTPSGAAVPRGRPSGPSTETSGSSSTSESLSRSGRPSLSGRMPASSLLMSKSQPGTPAGHPAMAPLTTSPSSSRLSRSRSITAQSPGVFLRDDNLAHMAHARNASHPDLRAIISAYEQSGGSQHTSVYKSTSFATDKDLQPGEEDGYDGQDEGTGLWQTGRNVVASYFGGSTSPSADSR
ncbi:uncharacterized protein L969DRAFT_17759 [Mixia osmundae IAM 14324]|uniref:Alpha/beta hydrolase fold-3 domain-containing protein n=1 Tax=Mixia osmundae (strain CBS 9802 / IAM 14324 / JCM 22182 / KY 12970) TaxID=764103 RepID=G7E225_MIXOS|nr:uncharacterized protein L969DRAFT_17759 [Mixia osmundae IAM 14324]KEI38680.1 hypothetical protein L969DRAFT_17759 [Mixia osmundae IAM 14324]GAA96862.1 hypothetical protein E5Q_03535 [Mixia osmundae IAM 14324]